MLIQELEERASNLLAKFNYNQYLTDLAPIRFRSRGDITKQINRVNETQKKARIKVTYAVMWDLCCLLKKLALLIGDDKVFNKCLNLEKAMDNKPYKDLNKSLNDELQEELNGQCTK